MVPPTSKRMVWRITEAPWRVEQRFLCCSVCGSLRRMLFLLACIVVKYGVLVFCRLAGSSQARCLLHLHFLKGTLGVKRSTTNWAVLRERGHDPLQFYWFRSAVKLFNSMLNTNSDTLRRVVQADLNLLVQVPAGQLNCWALFKDCVGVNCTYELFKLGVLFPCKSSLQIWSIGWEVFGETLSWWSPTRTTTLATYHSWFATPFSRNERMPTIVPQYLHLDLSKHVSYEHYK